MIGQANHVIVNNYHGLFMVLLGFCCGFYNVLSGYLSFKKKLLKKDFRSYVPVKQKLNPTIPESKKKANKDK